MKNPVGSKRDSLLTHSDGVGLYKGGSLSCFTYLSPGWRDGRFGRIQWEEISPSQGLPVHERKWRKRREGDMSWGFRIARTKPK